MVNLLCKSNLFCFFLGVTKFVPVYFCISRRAVWVPLQFRGRSEAIREARSEVSGFWARSQSQSSYPIGSMYAIYGNIYHQYTPNVSIYTSTMDPMGMNTLGRWRGFEPWVNMSIPWYPLSIYMQPEQPSLDDSLKKISPVRQIDNSMVFSMVFNHISVVFV